MNSDGDDEFELVSPGVEINSDDGQCSIGNKQMTEQQTVSDSSEGLTQMSGDTWSNVAEGLRSPSSEALEAECLMEHQNKIKAPPSTHSSDSDEIVTSSDAKVEENSEWVDLTGSKEIFMKVLEPGETESKAPKMGDMVTISVNGQLRSNVDDAQENASGTDDSNESWAEISPSSSSRSDVAVDVLPELSFVLGGYESPIDAWELAVLQMKPGEKAVVNTTHRFAYGDLGRSPDIPPQANLSYNIKLLKVDEAPKIEGMTADERINYVQSKKDLAASFFQRQEYAKALKNYEGGISAANVGAAFELTEEQAIIVLNNFHTVLSNNAAACHLKLENYPGALREANQCLRHERTNIKALFRKAIALKHLGRLDDALQTLRDALRIEPDSRLFVKEMADVERRRHREQQQKRRLYSRMLQDVRHPRPSWRIYRMMRFFFDNPLYLGAFVTAVGAVWLFAKITLLAINQHVHRDDDEHGFGRFSP